MKKGLLIVLQLVAPLIVIGLAIPSFEHIFKSIRDVYAMGIYKTVLMIVALGLSIFCAIKNNFFAFIIKYSMCLAGGFIAFFFWGISIHPAAVLVAVVGISVIVGLFVLELLLVYKKQGFPSVERTHWISVFTPVAILWAYGFFFFFIGPFFATLFTGMLLVALLGYVVLQIVQMKTRNKVVMWLKYMFTVTVIGYACAAFEIMPISYEGHYMKLFTLVLALFAAGGLGFAEMTLNQKGKAKKTDAEPLITPEQLPLAEKPA